MLGSADTGRSLYAKTQQVYNLNNNKGKIYDRMVCGNIPMEKPLNLKVEIKKFTNNPLNPLIKYLNSSLVEHDDVGNYYRAFDNYFLSLERVLSHISIGSRFQRQVKPYYGGGRKFSIYQNTISRQYRSQRKFFELDFTNYLIHTRILLETDYWKQIILENSAPIFLYILI